MFYSVSIAVFLTVVQAIAVRACRWDQYACSDGTCIPSSWRCDGEYDCYDDETNCPDCDGKFECSGHCIDFNEVCDGYDDCYDYSDEQDCCSSSQYTCDNGDCIWSSYECDGYDDCTDGSDEDNCAPVNTEDVGLIVGLIVPFVIMTLMSAACVVGVCYYQSRRRRQHVLVTRVVSSVPIQHEVIVVTCPTTDLECPPSAVGGGGWPDRPPVYSLTPDPAEMATSVPPPPQYSAENPLASATVAPPTIPSTCATDDDLDQSQY